MTKQYKFGDKVLVEAFVRSTHYHESGCYLDVIGSRSNKSSWAAYDKIRPYTPRQEFENGEVVEVSDNGMLWRKALYIGKSHCGSYLHLANIFRNPHDSKDVSLYYAENYKQVRKLQPRETITICGVDYYKDDVEKALKDLKPIKGDL